jgi:hypothetical protein
MRKKSQHGIELLGVQSLSIDAPICVLHTKMNVDFFYSLPGKRKKFLASHCQ